MALEIMVKHTEFQDKVNHLRIYLTHSEVEHSNNNQAAEGKIGHMKNHLRQNIVSKKLPKRLWYYGLFHQDGILSRISHGKTGRTGIEEVTGQALDISKWLGFEFYDHVWWLDKNHPSTTDDNIVLGRWLKISHKIDINMCYWVLTVSVKLITQTIVNCVMYTDLIDPDTKQRIDKFDK